MINAIIVENDPKATKIITELLRLHFSEKIKILCACETLDDAVKQIKERKPELLFLDVELNPPDKGFDVLMKTQGLNYKVIFTTSHSNYAREAMRHNQLDFIDKPFGQEELQRSIDRYEQNATNDVNNLRLQALLDNQKQAEINKYKVSIPVKNGFRNFIVEDIIYCYSKDDNSIIQLIGKDYHVTSKTLEELSEIFFGLGFFLSHKSNLINLWHVKQFKHVRDGGQALLTDGYEADVSKRNKVEFLKLSQKRK